MPLRCLGCCLCARTACIVRRGSSCSGGGGRGGGGGGSLGFLIPLDIGCYGVEFSGVEERRRAKNARAEHLNGGEGAGEGAVGGEAKSGSNGSMDRNTQKKHKRQMTSESSLDTLAYNTSNYMY